jgi:hypothetical protein
MYETVALNENFPKEHLMHILEKQLQCKISEEQITCEHYCYDDRIGWDTYIIGLKNYGVVGFTNGDLND